MALLLDYPSSIELSTVDQNYLPILSQMDPIFQLFPVVEKDASLVAWEQRDDYLGLMQIRGYDAEFPAVPPAGQKRFMMEPGVYGEHDLITEYEITTRKGFGSMGQPINIRDIVVERTEKLATRHYQRMSWIMWTLLTTGRFVVTGPTGAVVKEEAYNAQRFTAGVTWATVATASPLGNFRSVALMHRGSSVNFGSRAVAFMNQVTFNYMVSNTNANDLGGRRATGFQTIEGLADVNTLTAKDGLPNIVIFDEGYKDDAGTFTTYIPDNVIIVVGRRVNGASIGEFQLTRNASNSNVSSAPLVRVVDEGADENTKPPRKISVFRGFNGGPCIYYPGSVVIMSV